jgi:uncharacterized protein with PIN domain
MFLLTTDIDIVSELTGLGAAGVMGLMWLWERRYSQKREQQLDDAHARIISDEVKLEELIAVVRQNAEALVRLTTTHEQLLRQLQKEVA